MQATIDSSRQYERWEGVPSEVSCCVSFPVMSFTVFECNDRSAANALGQSSFLLNVVATLYHELASLSSPTL